MIGHQINIIYLSCIDIIDELVNKLEQGGRKCLKNRVDTLSVADILSDVAMNVLVLRQRDVSNLGNVIWSDFPRSNAVIKNKSVSVAFCIDCDEIPVALSEHFLIRETSDSAEEIRRGIVQIHSQMFQTMKGRYGYFVGRNSEIEQFQNLLYSERASRINALVVSGRPGVGREAYVRECIRQEKGIENYEPYILSMGKNSSIELFLVQLNSIHHLYSEDEFIKILGNGVEEKVQAAVNMLNDLFKDDDYLLLYDDGAACVRYDRGLSEWFKSVATSSLLKGGIHFYIISNISVSYSRIRTDEEVAYITLYGLTLSDRKKLLYKCFSELFISLPEDQVAFIAEKLVYSPGQLLKISEDIKTKGFKRIKEEIADYQIVGDKRISALLHNYMTSDHPEAINVLVLLSRIEYVSNKIISSVFSDTFHEVEEEIDRFMADGIVERFGEWMDLMRLDSSVSEYIRRNRIDYNDKSLSGLVIEKLDDMLETTPRITEDYTACLYKLREGVRRGRIEKEAYLVPSVLVNTIAESYEEKRWKQTIKLCESIREAHTKYFKEVYREIDYWYCLALAREQCGEKFYQVVNDLTDLDRHFLKGFYHRIGKQFAMAEEEYNKALKINPSFSRAKREMVIVLQAQHRFREALEMAKLNYEKEPENTYHIHAYFRCLVRKTELTQDDRNLLEQFKSESKKLFRSKYYPEGMDFEYRRFVDREKPDVLLPRANVLMTKYKDIAYIKDIVDDYYVSQGLESNLKPVDYSDELLFI